MDKKILIIDDNEDDILIIKRKLKETGYGNLVTADDMASGLEAAERENPVLVITDTVLPDGDGFEVCRRLKDRASGENPKVIVMTGCIAAIDAEKARVAGADDYRAKTSDCASILEAVENILC